MEARYQPGDIVKDRYRIIGILGQGVTATTYEAVDPTQANATAAIKVLSLRQSQDWKLVELFETALLEVLTFLFCITEANDK